MSTCTLHISRSTLWSSLMLLQEANPRFVTSIWLLNSIKLPRASVVPSGPSLATFLSTKETKMTLPKLHRVKAERYQRIVGPLWFVRLLFLDYHGPIYL